ncbi:hypothetical protein CYMTET_33054 [Cymbomonas tetramitiformis]|uniref:Uncharacterized protein n=1 Tax=Cymbomonas tetramitiformis TaxID=36881 RepID=A0AAE0FDR4_9CHLO|nr:hypothetical protein CYMTET_33054 [Cymbomonas tetramitiformis]
MPKITENLPGVEARRSGVTYVPKIANAEFPRDSESSKYYCKVMRAPPAMNNICNNLTWRKTHPRRGCMVWSMGLLGGGIELKCYLLKLVQGVLRTKEQQESKEDKTLTKMPKHQSLSLTMSQSKSH